ARSAAARSRHGEIAGDQTRLLIATFGVVSLHLARKVTTAVGVELANHAEAFVTARIDSDHSKGIVSADFGGQERGRVLLAQQPGANFAAGAVVANNVAVAGRVQRSLEDASAAARRQVNRNEIVGADAVSSSGRGALGSVDLIIQIQVSAGDGSGSIGYKTANTGLGIRGTLPAVQGERVVPIEAGVVCAAPDRDGEGPAGCSAYIIGNLNRKGRGPCGVRC